MLTEEQAIAAAHHLRGKLDAERQDLDVLRRYATGKQELPLVVPKDAPAEVRELARIARINLIAIVVNSLVESLYVDNIRMSAHVSPGPSRNSTGATPTDPDAALKPIWKAWQDNRMDREQAGLYRAAFQYGYAYAAVTPGKPSPLARALSPRRMHAAYDPDSPAHPVMALEWRKGSTNSYRLYSLSDEGDVGVYTLGWDPEKKRFALIGESSLAIGYVPIIKYLPSVDLDSDDEPEMLGANGSARNTTVAVMTAGEVAPLMTLQDQTDVTSFGLKSAEWYTAFRQRWAIGWTPENRAQKMASGASQFWTFDESPDDMKLGEFAETELRGFLESRESVMRYSATLSQTPVHELTGQLVNLSAEALTAAEAGRDRKVELAKTSLGESHEMLAQAIGDLGGNPVPSDIEIVWRDTSARAFGAIIDGLGKVAQMLQVPPQMLWDRIPGTTRQDVERWREAAEALDPMDELAKTLDRQANQPEPAGSKLILPPGVRR